MKHLSTLIAGLAFAVGVSGCASMSGGSGWITLLDGAKPDTAKDWSRVGEDNWRVEDGAVIADKRSGKESTYLVSKNSYTDLQIRAVVWVTTDTNSGVFFRCADPAHISAVSCYEMNIFDSYNKPWYGTGAIARYGKGVDPEPKAGGKWSTFDITVKGTHFLVLMDGKKTVELDDSTHASGPIALQYGGGIVKWRTVQVKPL